MQRAKLGSAQTAWLARCAEPDHIGIRISHRDRGEQITGPGPGDSRPAPRQDRHPSCQRGVGRRVRAPKSWPAAIGARNVQAAGILDDVET